jgi:hypothetical protein
LITAARFYFKKTSPIFLRDALILNWFLLRRYFTKVIFLVSMMFSSRIKTCVRHICPTPPQRLLIKNFFSLANLNAIVASPPYCDRKMNGGRKTKENIRGISLAADFLYNVQKFITRRIFNFTNKRIV